MQRKNSRSSTDSAILTTSLRIPQLPEGLLTRPILLSKLDQVLEFPLTLITAPPGFGKTTLLGQWIPGSKNAMIQNCVAWVSLENECDLRQFWTYIITALQQIQSEIGRAAFNWLDTSPPPVHAILRTVINEIVAVERDLVLILDDYHHLDDPAIHATLSFFIDHLPANLHLVITSRSQPPLSLARWRASNQLCELREDDLRFTGEEVSTFINELKGLNLSPHEISALETRTEGWIAGLQLVVLSIQDYDDQSKRNFVSTFTGSQRYVLDYLIEEVLQQQPDHIKPFLLRTSILDQLSASLCDSVTGQNDGQATLEYLERGHLFMIPLDHEQRWYRYHHLFKDVLYHQLTRTEPDSVLDLHRRATEWFINAGRTEEAIRHACAAHEWDQAVELIEPVIHTIWNRGEIRKIINWLERLPTEYLDAHPHMYFYYLRALFHGGEMETAKRRLLEEETVLKDRQGTNLSAEGRLQLGTIYAFRTLAAAVSGKPENALAMGREALSLIPSENVGIRGYAKNALGVTYYYLGNLAEAVQTLAEGGRLAQQAGNLFPMIAAAMYQAEALVCQGELKQAAQILQQALYQAQIPSQATPSWLPAASYVCIGLGNLLYEWNRLDESERYLREAIELGEQLAFGSAPWSAYQTLARIKLVQGDLEGAREMIILAQHYGRTHSLPIPARLIEATQARAWLALGQLDQAERWARSSRVDDSPSPALVQEFENITLVRLYLHQGRPTEALALLNQIRTTAVSSEHKDHVIEILLLTALAQHSLDETPFAIESLHAALEMAEPQGYIRTFVDAGQPIAVLLYQALTQGIMPNYIGMLLSAFPGDDRFFNSASNPSRAPQDRSASEQLIQPLSKRELEVLQMIASGASNQDIAEAMVIAVTTAKKHVSNIIRKLGVNNRTQAVTKGRNLGLCE